MEICQKCGGTKYTDALKQYNTGKSTWCIPRKGTELHKEVLKIMNAPKKPSRKLIKAPTNSMTYLGKESQKRIEEFTRTKPTISTEMEIKKTRKLRKATESYDEQIDRLLQQAIQSNPRYKDASEYDIANLRRTIKTNPTTFMTPKERKEYELKKAQSPEAIERARLEAERDAYIESNRKLKAARTAETKALRKAERAFYVENAKL